MRKTKLSVNVNKIATLRNSRGGNYPNVCDFAADIQEYGADGITIHPRPDERHIRYKDAYDLKNVVTTEFNIEGNPIENSLVWLRYKTNSSNTGARCYRCYNIKFWMGHEYQ